MDPLRHQNVVLHPVELNLRQFREEGLNLVGGDAIVVHDTTDESSLLFLLAQCAVVQGPKLSFAELTLS